jgi:uncharacterized protein (DUF2267 family)
MTSEAFLEAVARRLACDARRAEAVTFSVFQELRDRLTPVERRDTAAQLPLALKRLWTVGDHEGRIPTRLHRDEFVGRVRQRAVLPDEDEAFRAILAVFGALQRALGSSSGREGQAGDILSQLPKDLKTLWLDAARG